MLPTPVRLASLLFRQQFLILPSPHPPLAVLHPRLNLNPYLLTRVSSKDDT